MKPARVQILEFISTNITANRKASDAAKNDATTPDPTPAVVPPNLTKLMNSS